MEIRLLQPTDLDLLLRVRDGLFDDPVDPIQARAFLASDLHHMVMGFEAGQAVAFASGTVLLHPDKNPSMFINEVGTHEDHQRQGYGLAVSQALIDHARAIGCDGIWLGTEPDNIPALALYRKLGGDERAFVGFGWDEAFEID